MIALIKSAVKTDQSNCLPISLRLTITWVDQKFLLYNFHIDRTLILETCLFSFRQISKINFLPYTKIV